MSNKRVTSLDEIREQAEPEVITIPGFRPGTTINVAVKAVDLTPILLETGISNPLTAIVQKKTMEGKSKEEIEKEIEDKASEGIDVNKLLPAIDAIVKETLVQPTYEEITAIRELTLDQKLAIFDYATGGNNLISFRKK